MNNKYTDLFKEYTFNNGQTINTRFALAPMINNGSTLAGYITEEDINYYTRRADVASLLISCATYVEVHGNSFGYGIGNYADDQLEGLTELAQAMKSKGNKAILQLYHPGREAKVTYETHGKVYGPSTMEFDFLDYPVTGLTEEQVEKMIENFVAATDRAIEAGFDGVEIHGANHYLIQQFFSKTSNKRDDKWGGKLENRARFGLEIVKRIQERIKEHKKDNFILGYRISPEEIHGGNIGYTLDDSLYLIDKLADLGIDYIHSSKWGEEAYKAPAEMGKYKGESTNKVIYDLIRDRTALVVVGDILTPEAAVDALNYGDIVALGSAVLFDPEFKNKIAEGKENEINFDVTDRYEDLALPKHFPIMIAAVNASGEIPKSTFEVLRENTLDEDKKYVFSNKNI